jgi:hypothetical protein
VKTLASQLIAFATALIFLGLGDAWANGFMSVIGVCLLLLNWFFAALTWAVNYQEVRPEDFTKLFRN